MKLEDPMGVSVKISISKIPLFVEMTAFLFFKLSCVKTPGYLPTFLFLKYGGSEGWGDGDAEEAGEGVWLLLKRKSKTEGVGVGVATTLVTSSLNFVAAK